MKMSWTQPICDSCWFVKYPGRVPMRIMPPIPERCVECNGETSGGIYVRVDPATAKFPSIVEGEEQRG